MALQSTLSHKSTHATGGADALTPADITNFTAAVVAAAPPTTNASLLTSGTLADARLSATAAASLAKADSALQDQIVVSGASSESAGANGTYTKGANINGYPAWYKSGTTLVYQVSLSRESPSPYLYRWEIRQGTIQHYVTPTGASDPSTLPSPIGLTYSGAYGSAVIRSPHTHAIADTTGLQAALDGAEPTITTLPISKGGTGSTTAPNALTALGAVAKTGDTMTGLLTMDADVQMLPSRVIYAGDPEDPEATNTQILHSGINLYNGAGISFGGVGDALARANLRNQIGAEPTITTLPISKGGTGATTAAGALTALGAVGSNTTAAQGGTQLLNMVQITAAAYNAIATPTVNTLYIIVG